jgi:hypothetical protein
MKTILLLMVLIISSIDFSQEFKLGFAGGVAIDSKHLNHQLGPSVIGDFTFKNIPIFIRAGAQYYLSELNNENNLSWSANNNFLNVGFSVNCYYRYNIIQPYVGAGVFYNFNNIESAGKPSKEYDGALHGFSNVENNASLEITGGIKLLLKTDVDLLLELTQSFNSPEYDQSVFNVTTNQRTVRRASFNFDAILVKFGALFSL